MKFKYKHRLKILGSLFLLMTIANVAIFVSYSKARLTEVPHDVDRKANGNTLICTVTFGEMLAHITRRSDHTAHSLSDKHRVIEVDGPAAPAGKLVSWWPSRNTTIEIKVVAAPRRLVATVVPQGERRGDDLGDDDLLAVNRRQDHRHDAVAGRLIAVAAGVGGGHDLVDAALAPRAQAGCRVVVLD